MKDTTSFINRLTAIGWVPQNAIFFSMDVLSLYANIAFIVRLAAIRALLNEQRKDSECPKYESLLQLLDFVMNMNNFQFDGKDYLQVGGTAVGTRVAPALQIL